MSWNTMLSRVAGMFSSRLKRDSDLREEIRAHIELETEENVQQGMDPVKARQAALLKFGNPQLTAEDVRAMWTLPRFESVLADLRYGGRMLRKSPGFAAVAILTLALGIGATTAIFSVAYSILIKPLPYPNPQELVLVHQFDEKNDTGVWRATALDFLDRRERAHSFTGMASYSGTGLVLTGSGPAEMVLGQKVSSEMFRVLDVKPMLGRDFRREEEQKGQERVIILSYGLWQSKFGGREDVLGKVITVNGEPVTVVGVMPRDFMFPAKQYQAWMPMAFYGKVDPQWINRSAHFLRVLARMKPGLTISQADREMKQISRELGQQYPSTSANESSRVQSLSERVIGNVRGSLVLLVIAAACLLLIACSNIANLLLARGTAREREIAVRQALGAANGRIFRQLLTENLLLTLLGGSLGWSIAYLLVVLVRHHGPADLPRLDEIGLDSAELLFNSVIALTTGVLFSLVPLSSLKRKETADALKSGSATVSGGRALQRLRSSLVVSQIAISGLLLIVAGLTVRSLMHLSAVDPGFNPVGAVSFSLVMTEQEFPQSARMRTFTRDVLEQLRGMQGLERVGFTTSLPFNLNSWSNPVSVDGSALSPIIGIRPISPQYLEAMQTPLRSGRHFTESDNETSEPVALISESAARKLFAGVDPVGRHVKLGQTDSEEAWRRIVGVVADIRENSLNEAPEPLLYLPYYQLGDQVTAMFGRGVYLVVRSGASPSDVISYARARIDRLDSNVPIHDVELMSELVSASMAQPRFRSLLFASFGALALILASIGLYGVLSYLVAQRTREFGIRIALGARPSNLLQLIFSHGGRLIGIGLGLAALAAILVHETVQTILFGMSSLDASTFAVVIVTICAIAGLATLVPARRAMRADPLSAIRYE